MPIARHVTLWRFVGVGAAALALSTAAATSAYAGDCPGGHGWNKGHQTGYKPGQGAGVKTATDLCEFSLDGQTWKGSVQVDDLNLKPSEDGKVHVKVRAAKDAASCTASLASYRTHGATWETSGNQVFHDFDTVKVKSGAGDTLDIAVPDVGCFAQVDLYRGAVKYDGLKGANDGFEHGDLPVGPQHAVILDKLIASWNGGTKNCTEQTIPSTPASPPSTPATSTPSDTPTDETSTTPAPPASSAPAPSETVSGAESSPAAANSPSPAGDVDAVASESPAGGLAETGSSNVGITVGGAAVLLAAGGAALLITRRRQAARRH